MRVEFPIRILLDDGSCEEIASPEELMAQVDAFDSDDPRVWVRDAMDRTVRLVVRHGAVLELAVAAER
jgi:hypothetical protein